jgi:hypothetical protein
MRYLRPIFFIALFFTMMGQAYAALPPTPTKIDFNTQKAWEYTLAPYLWAINLQGRVAVADQTVHIDQSFNDLLKKLNFGGMLWIDAKNDRFGAFLNVLYTVLSMNDQDNILDVNARNDFLILSTGLSYDLYRHDFINGLFARGTFIITPYLGFRYTENDTEVKVSLPSIALKAQENQYWTDPIIGARFNFLLNHAWSLILSGDIGGLNTSTQYSYNVMGIIGYHPTVLKFNTTFYLGYRFLDQRYQTGKGVNFFNWDMKIFGPVLGVSITF